MTHLQSNAASSPDQINGWMTAWLVINALVLLSLWLNLGDPDGLGAGFDGLLYAMMALGSLAYVGAILVKTGQPRWGAIIFIIGSAVFVPIGAVGVIGGLRLLDRVKQAGAQAGLAVDPDEKPTTEVFAKNTGTFFGLGIASIVLGVAAMGFGATSGGMLVGLGVLHIAIAMSAQKNAAVALYGDYVALRPGAARHDRVSYRDIVDVVVEEGKSLVVRFKQGERERSCTLQASAIGADEVQRIGDELRRRVQTAA